MYANKTALEMIHRTLSETVAKEVESDYGKAMLGIVLQVTEQLINREDNVHKHLAKALLSGERLLAKLQLKVKQSLNKTELVGAEPVDIGLVEIAALEKTSLPLLIARYHQLKTSMDELATTLLEQSNEEQPNKEQIAELLYEAACWEENAVTQQLTPVSIEPCYEPAYRHLNAENLQVWLDGYYREGEKLSVTEFVTASGGMSKETYLFTAEDSNDRLHKLVARKDGQKPIFKIDCFMVASEFDLVVDLFKANYPVPEPLHLAQNVEGIDGDFYLLRQVEGVTLGSVFDGDSGVSEAVLLQLAGLFAQLHSLPMETFINYIGKHCHEDTLSWSVEKLIRHDLLRWREYLKTYPKSPSSVETYMDAWLCANLPQSNEPPVLVHGDMSIHNLLIHEGEISTVLDWEVAHFGHPAEDLSYVREMVSARMDWNAFMQHYYACGGRFIADLDMQYYEVLGYRQKVVAANFMATTVDKCESDDIRNLAVAIEYQPKFIARGMAPIHKYHSIN